MNRGIPMANSKSNIYPIQLQGAALCLNRYDAEIKQYSGFNKNNSPFVGGCLSNVFEKDETIEGATDENTYIDENGDKYRLINNNNLYEFFKNDELLGNAGIANDTGIRKRKLISEKKIYKYYNDEIYLYKRYDIEIGRVSYILRYGDNDFNFNWSKVGSIRVNDPEYEDTIVNEGFNGVFIKYTNDNNYTFVLGMLYGDGRVFLIITKKNGVFSLNDVSSYPQQGDTTFFSPVGICYNSTQNQILFFYTPRTGRGTNDLGDYCPTKCSAFSINENNELVLLGETSSLDTLTSDTADILTNSIRCYQVCSHPFNKILLKKFQPNVSKNFNGKKLVFRLRNPYYEDGVIKYTVNLSTSGWNTDFIHGVDLLNTDSGLTTVRTLGKGDTEHYEAGTFTPLVCSYDLQLGVSSGGIYDYYSLCLHLNPHACYTQGFNFKDDTTATFKLCSYVLGEMFSLGSNFNSGTHGLLFNNNQLTGIGSKYVLEEGWSNIDVWSLSLYNRSVYYKRNSEWFVMEPDTRLKFKKILNQFVFNTIFSVYNSYDYKRNKWLRYAPSYNSFILPYKAAFYSTASQSNNLWVAGAVNEYRQEDNSSIILNPVNVGITDTNSLDITSNFIGYINFYTGTETKILYKDTYFYYSSVSTRRWRNPNLINMPFPADTNGNVEYSPTLFSDVLSIFGDKTFIKDGGVYYPLAVGNNNQPIMSYFLASGIDNLELAFIIQGQFFGVINNGIYSIQFNKGVVADMSFIVDVSNLQFVGNTPYEALFYSKTNRCLYSFTGANVLNQKQLVDKISEVKDYLYNPATQTVFLITDIGVLFYGLFGMFLLEYTDITNIFLLDNGIVMSDNNGNYRYIKYYLDEGDTDYIKENINVETSFYGMNNEMVTINDCLYFRIFSEEHEEGDLKVSATTISLRGRKTEETTFKIKASDWDKITHTIYLRYQPKTQRGLGVAFAIDSPFKIASMSVGSQPDAVLVDKVSKGAITAPSVTTNNNEW